MNSTTRIIFCFQFGLLCGSHVAAQQVGVDTVALTLQEAEQRLLQSNLHLRAARSGIEASRAAIEQARIWNNPTLSVAQNIYSQSTGKYFDFSKAGDMDMSVELTQTFLLGGKRSNQGQLATIDAQVSEQTLKATLRDLRLELRKSFFTLRYLQRLLAFYDENIPLLRQMVMGMESVFLQRSILLSELLRLRSLLLTLESERLDVVNTIADKQAALRILLADERDSNKYYTPQVDSSLIEATRMDTLSLESVVKYALDRPDLRLAEEQVQQHDANLSLQKSLAIPDISIGGQWSRRGAYIPNFYGVTLSIDLPLFNRNQGNIAVAERTLEAAQYERDNLHRAVDQEVRIAWTKARAADALYRSLDHSFIDDYHQLVDGMIKSYQARNISLLQFTDFFESYRSSMVQLNQLRSNRLEAFEDLNHAAGRVILNP